MKRVALVRLDALGDTLLTTPAVQMLQRELPGAELLVMTHPVGTAVMRGLCRTCEVTSEQSWKQLAALLREFAPDAVLCCSEKRRAALATWASGAPTRVGFDPGWSQPLKSLATRLFFTRTVPWCNNPERVADCHEAERYGRLVERLLGREGLEVPPLHLEVGTSASPVPHRVGVQLTAKWCRFGYTVQHLRRWLEALQVPLVGFAAPSEAEWARRHFSALPLLVSADLQEYAGWLQQLQAFVTIDTGAAHVAAARGVPTVDVFPALHQEHCVTRWRPWRTPHQIVILPPFSGAAVEHVEKILYESLRNLMQS